MAPPDYGGEPAAKNPKREVPIRQRSFARSPMQRSPSTLRGSREPSFRGDARGNIGLRTKSRLGLEEDGDDRLAAVAQALRRAGTRRRFRRRAVFGAGSRRHRGARRGYSEGGGIAATPRGASW